MPESLADHRHPRILRARIFAWARDARPASRHRNLDRSGARACLGKGRAQPVAHDSRPRHRNRLHSYHPARRAAQRARARTDISQSALALAAHNAARLGVADRACFLAADWLDAIEGGFDLIVANPPYLAAEEIERLAPEVAVYDPPGALCGGPDGLEAYRRIAGRVHRVLAPDGRLFVEIGPTQAQEVTEIFRTIGLEVGALGRDLAGRPRVVVAGR